MAADEARRARLLRAIDDEGGHVAPEEAVRCVERMLDQQAARRGLAQLPLFDLRDADDALSRASRG